MKILCASCDEQMDLQKVARSDESSMTVTFHCSRCGSGASLLTNPGETQLVRALNVQLGGRLTPLRPMELLSANLARKQASCPPAGPAASHTAARPRWSEAAERRLQNVPAFVRAMARRAIERYALEEGHAEITSEVMDRARDEIGI
jgi:hypothetical protein